MHPSYLGDKTNEIPAAAASNLKPSLLCLKSHSLCVLKGGRRYVQECAYIKDLRAEISLVDERVKLQVSLMHILVKYSEGSGRRMDSFNSFI